MSRLDLPRCEFGVRVPTEEGIESCGEPAVAKWDLGGDGQMLVCEQHDRLVSQQEDEIAEEETTQDACKPSITMTKPPGCRPTDEEIRKVLHDHQIMADGCDLTVDDRLRQSRIMWISNCCLMRWFLGEGLAPVPLEDIESIKDLVAEFNRLRAEVN